MEYKGQWYLFYHNQSLSDQGNLRTVCIDYLYFNEDGTIKIVEQTREGVKSAGKAPVSGKTLKRYAVLDCILGQGAVLENKQKDSAVKVIRNLHLEGAYFQLNNADGGEGTRAAIRIYYTTEEKLAKLQLTVNEKDYTLLNAKNTGGIEKECDCTFITVNLKPGKTNTIRLTGGHGDITINDITIELLNN